MEIRPQSRGGRGTVQLVDLLEFAIEQANDGIALTAGGEIAGIPGLFLAVPVAGVIRVLIINFRPAREPDEN